MHTCAWLNSPSLKSCFYPKTNKHSRNPKNESSDSQPEDSQVRMYTQQYAKQWPKYFAKSPKGHCCTVHTVGVQVVARTSGHESVAASQR